jgi:DNA-binding CsgD family transcriptional regulator
MMLTSLTPRQITVLQMIAGGAQCEEVAQKLKVSRMTVHAHVIAIRERYELVGDGRTAMVFEGIRRGDIDELRAYQELECRRRVPLPAPRRRKATRVAT